MNRCYVVVWPRLALVCTLSGCAATPMIQEQREAQGRVFYVDGAGGGGLVVNWGRAVRAGLESAGSKRAFCDFCWQTGLGIVADQVASVSYKRAKARQLAGLIRTCRQAEPDRPVSLIGFSAGTAVAVYALEALPPDCAVDNVVLLAPSLSSQYDLTAALHHVRGRASVFISSADLMLRWLVPVFGTADRVYCGEAVAGLCGFENRSFARAGRSDAYSKIDTVVWDPRFVLSGNHGGHTDVVDARFVGEYVTPRLCTPHPPGDASPDPEVRLARADALPARGHW
jgi:pimeloyl-ACP methyl ester carboxylesterase